MIREVSLSIGDPISEKIAELVRVEVYPSNASPKDYLETLIEDDNVRNISTFACLSEDSKRVLATGALIQQFADVGIFWVDRMATAKDYRRQGLGSLVLLSIEKSVAIVAANAGSDTNILMRATASSSAIPFYMRHGYRQVDSSPENLAKYIN